MLKACTATVLFATLLAGCSTAPTTHNASGKLDASLSARGLVRPENNGSFLPSGAFKLTPNYSIAYADMILVAGVVALVYMVVDPTAPAWEIQEVRLPDRRVQYTLKMQYLHNGGEGEARQVLMRRAAALAREEGMTGFQVRTYTESIESRLFVPRRTAEAEVVMEYNEPPKPVAPSRPPLASM